MKQEKQISLSRAEAKLALEGVGELPYSDEGADLCHKLAGFLDE